MKLLPCLSGANQCQAERYALLPDGTVYAIGRTPQGIEVRPFSYQCSRCRQKTVLTAIEFNGLPDASLADLRKHGLETMVTKDLLGAGVTIEQIEELDAAGVDFATLHPTPEQRGSQT